MDFKQHIPTTDKSWLGIGRHLGSVVQKSLESNCRTIEELTDHLELPPELEEDGSIKPNITYVTEYIETYSFGVFFPAVQDFLKIPPQAIFNEGINNQQAEQANENLRNYLIELSTESMITFLSVKPGESLRDHMKAYLQKPDYLERLYNLCITDYFMGLSYEEDALKVIQTENFSGVDMNSFSGILCGLEVGVDELIPIREPTKAERYEVYQRWINQGG